MPEIKADNAEFLPEISVIIPIYNEKETIAAHLRDIHRVLDTFGQPFEILAIDDGSDDGTADCLQQVCFARKITHPYNKGNGAAIKTGRDDN